MNGQVVAYNDDATQCAPSSELYFDATNLGPLYIIVEGWGAFSGDYTIQINASYVGIDEHADLPFQLYPNPSIGELNVKANSGKYQLTDVQGKVLSTFDAAADSSQNFEQLAPGTYLLLQIETGQIQKWQKQ
jgi:hypothetical protein